MGELFNMLSQYLQDIFNTAKPGDVREESYYPCLQKLLESYTKQNSSKYYITSLPKKTEAGNPDFRILTAKKDLVGYIEAKDPSHDDLDKIENSEQLKRYRHTFPNLLLTNFFEFRHYRDGELINKVFIGRPFVVYKLKTVPSAENSKDFFNLLSQFFSYSIPQVASAKKLALELAKRTRFLRDQIIAEELKEEKIAGTQTLEGFYHAFKDHLIASLTKQDFSNLFAQTITYGLFAARSRAENGFNRILAYKYIPHTVGILRSVFRFISSTELPQPLEWIIDDIAEVLAAADVKKIMSDFYKEGKGRDPIIHFYETFLAEYDPKEREKRGVYYTPESVVKYIVNSIHLLLKEKFGKTEGFASPSVTVLDPAAGTLTFPTQAIFKAVEEFKNKYGDGGIKGFIKDNILKNFYAFELMMAPYAIGHLKIGFVLNELNYKLSQDERFNLFLTNTLDFTKEDPNKFPGIFEQMIAKESEKALHVKENIPIMVVMGNPPYSGISENKGDWILEQIKEYKQIEGKSLGERNPKWIQDDYVKFFRFAQWKIEKNGAGILGFITNHAWLDNPTFRGMRYSLLKTFDEIFILNLHGSTLKKEKTLEGGKDENVFDIQPGVAIAILVKQKEKQEKKIFYHEIWGLRGDVNQPSTKYYYLEHNNINTTEWRMLQPVSPHYFFIPKEDRGSEKYYKFQKITDIFPLNSVGVVTGRDEFVIDDNRQQLEARIRIFSDLQNTDEYIKEAYKLKDKPASKWYVKNARSKIKDEKDLEKFIIRILYRPFDERWIFYHPSVVERPRENVMKHMLRPNIALLAKRQQKQNFSYAFVSNEMTESCVFESAYANNTVLPLYLYNNKEIQQTIFEGQKKLDLVGAQHNLHIKKEKEPNINPDLFNNLQNTYNKDIAPEDIFYYIYGVLYSNKYRKKYQEFLKIDFPRVPFTNDYKIFSKLSLFGQELSDLHLLKSSKLEQPISKYFGKDSDLVKKVEFDKKTKRVYINDSQYFDNVDLDVWNYYIGGYQVLNKWLKDRKNKILSSEDIKHYCKIVTTISETIKIQKEIDRLYPEVEKNLI